MNDYTITEIEPVGSDMPERFMVKVKIAHDSLMVILVQNGAEDVIVMDSDQAKLVAEAILKGIS